MQAIPAAIVAFPNVLDELDVNENIILNGKRAEIIDECSRLVGAVGSLKGILSNQVGLLELAKEENRAELIKDAKKENERVKLLHPKVERGITFLDKRVLKLDEEVAEQVDGIKEIEQRWKFVSVDSKVIKCGIEDRFLEGCAWVYKVAGPALTATVFTTVVDILSHLPVVYKWVPQHPVDVKPLETIYPFSQDVVALDGFLELMVQLRDKTWIENSLLSNKEKAIKAYKGDERQLNALVAKYKTGIPEDCQEGDVAAKLKAKYKEKAAYEINSMAAKWKALEACRQEIGLALEARKNKFKFAVDHVVRCKEIEEVEGERALLDNDLLKRVSGLVEKMKSDMRWKIDENTRQLFYNHYRAEFAKLNRDIEEQRQQKNGAVAVLEKKRMDLLDFLTLVNKQKFQFREEMESVRKLLSKRDDLLVPGLNKVPLSDDLRIKIETGLNAKDQKSN